MPYLHCMCFVLNVSIVLGTGKSVTGAHLAFGFALLNKTKMKSQLTEKPCVLYCGPSNKSVEVVLSEIIAACYHTRETTDGYLAMLVVLFLPSTGANTPLGHIVVITHCNLHVLVVFFLPATGTNTPLALVQLYTVWFNAWMSVVIANKLVIWCIALEYFYYPVPTYIQGC